VLHRSAPRYLDSQSICGDREQSKGSDKEVSDIILINLTMEDDLASLSLQDLTLLYETFIVVKNASAYKGSEV
jgi:hypothetical protein